MEAKPTFAEKLDINYATLREIYRQMSRIHEVDKAIQAGLSSGKFSLPTGR